MTDKSQTKDWAKIREEFDAAEAASQKNIDAQESEDLNDETIENDMPAGNLPHPSYQELEDKLTAAEQKADEYLDQLRRHTADMENIRRRTEREVANAHRFGIEKLVQSFLPVSDSLEQAILLAEKQGDIPLHEGLLLTMKLFVEALEKSDVKQIDPLGLPFNPQEHEAMSVMPSPDFPPNTVINVFQKGYLIGERVIRPARVIVSK